MIEAGTFGIKYCREDKADCSIWQGTMRRTWRFKKTCTTLRTRCHSYLRLINDLQTHVFVACMATCMCAYTTLALLYHHSAPRVAEANYVSTRSSLLLAHPLKNPFVTSASEIAQDECGRPLVTW